MSGDKEIIRVGSRKSELALIQTRYVISLLSKKFPHYEFQIVSMSTMGDQVLDKPLPKIGEKSLFTKELEVALAAECVDFVVHSLKDLPTVLPEGMAIGAVLKREDPRDALVLRKDLKCNSLSELKPGSVIGTSSLRRTAQLSRLYPHLKIENIRGNLNTRLKKLDDLGIYSAIILAKAGLIRMGWGSRISQVLDSSEILYAVGQGALAVECRENDVKTLEMLSTLHDPETLLVVLAERSFLKTLEGGCSAPVAVCSKFNEGTMNLIGAVWSLDGKTIVTDSDSCSYEIQDKSSPSSLDNSPTREFQLLANSFNKDLPSGSAEMGSGDTSVRKCPYDCSNGSPKKKLKFDSEISETDNVSSANLSEIKRCPFSGQVTENGCPMSALPIGIDFMGKCPYLDKHELSKCPVNAEVLVINSVAPKLQLKCPFFNSENNTCGNCEPNLITECPFKGNNNVRKLFCGLNGSKYVSNDCLRKVEELGINLAKKLIDKGALTIMEQAKAHIHGTAHEINKVRA